MRGDTLKRKARMKAAAITIMVIAFAIMIAPLFVAPYFTYSGKVTVKSFLYNPFNIHALIVLSIGIRLFVNYWRKYVKTQPEQSDDSEEALNASSEKKISD